MDLTDNVTIIRRRVRWARLYVRENGAVELVVPRPFSEDIIQSILRRKAGWIERRRTLMRARLSRIPALKDDEVRLFGEPYRIIRDPNRGSDVEVDTLAKHILTGCDLGASAARLAWQRAYADEYLRQRLANLANCHGFTYRRATVRAQRTRWGSCSRKTNISLNWRLILAPEHVIDYVLLHELAHTRVLNHGREFWAQMRAVCPEYPAAVKWLRQTAPGFVG